MGHGAEKDIFQLVALVQRLGMDGLLLTCGAIYGEGNLVTACGEQLALLRYDA